MKSRYNIIVKAGDYIIDTDFSQGFPGLFDFKDHAFPHLSARTVRKIAEELLADPAIDGGQELHDKLMEYV